MANYPLINSVKYDWSSVEVDLGPAGGIITGCTELTYEDSLEPGEARGTAAQLLARTRGQYSASGAITLFKKDATELITALGEGFKEVPFDVTVSYTEDEEGTTVDKLFGCRIIATPSGGSQGSDPLAVAFTLSIMRINWNGIDPVKGMLK